MATYGNVLSYSDCTFAATALTSSLLSTINLPARVSNPTGGNFGSGSACLARLIFPSNWTTADVTFSCAETSGGPVSPHFVSDGANKIQITIPGVAAGDSVVLQPWWFYSNPFIRINSSTAQLNACTVVGVLQPIIQGNTP